MILVQDLQYYTYIPFSLFAILVNVGSVELG